MPLDATRCLQTLLFLTLACLTLGCSTDLKSKYDIIEVGMPESEVVEIIGWEGSSEITGKDKMIVELSASLNEDSEEPIFVYDAVKIWKSGKQRLIYFFDKGKVSHGSYDSQ